MDFKNIILETNDGVGILKINRPQVLNALNFETVGEIENGIKKLEADKEVKIIVVTGSGDKAFVAGADIAAMSNMPADKAHEFASRGHRSMKAIEDCSKVVIAAVNGFALGGGTEVALACDFIYASDNAKFGLPEVKLGIFPGFGGTQRLSRVVGIARARELIFSGRQITADEAFKIGLVNKVVPKENLMNEVMVVAKEIAANGLAAVGFAKHAINAGVGKDFEDGLDIEKEDFAKCFATEERVEGMKAFLEKRRPKWISR